MLSVNHATRSGKEKDVNTLWNMLQSKYDFKDLYIQLADENKQLYNSGNDNYKIIMADTDRKRIVFVDMTFSHLAFASVYENGVKVASLDYVDLYAEQQRTTKSMDEWKDNISERRENTQNDSPAVEQDIKKDAPDMNHDNR